MVPPRIQLYFLRATHHLVALDPPLYYEEQIVSPQIGVCMASHRNAFNDSKSAWMVTLIQE
jgi:hypothetical protein